MRNSIFKLIVLLLVFMLSLCSCEEIDKLLNSSNSPTVNTEDSSSENNGEDSEGSDVCTHQWIDPTCTEAGYCSVCNQTSLPAKGHNYEASITAPTCTEIGYTTYTCSLCSSNYTADEVPAKGHEFIDGICSICNEENPDYIPECKHSWIAPTCTTDGYCSICKEVGYTATGHNYKTVVTAPTCTDDGCTTYICENCNDSYTDNKTLAIGHNYVNGFCSVCSAKDPNYSPSIDGKFDYTKIPEYSGDHYVVVNGNMPYFTEDEITDKSFESYGEFDELGRCTVAFASLGKDLLPTGTRPSISYNPTGWVQNSYPSSIVPQSQIYNRSHLIAWSLAGEGNNKLNLITGTPYFNQLGMQIFENMVLDYIKETDNHVMYRVTPIFVGNDLVARGVLMEGLSVEDNGEGICFNVFMYNVQPGITIDYATGENGITPSDNPGGESETITATLVTDISQLTVGAKIVIVAKDSNYALGSQTNNNRSAVIVTKDGNTVLLTEEVQIITVGQGKTSGSFSLAVEGGYLYAASSSKNLLKTETTLSNNGSWNITIAKNGAATIKATGSNTRNWLRFNSQNCLFAAYSTAQNDVCIYIIN